MMRSLIPLVTLGLFASGLLARGVPDNVRNFYDKVKAGKCQGEDLLRGGFFDTEDGSTEFGYCQQDVAGQAIFLKGNGKFVNMDIDCDGNQSDPNQDGRCKSSADTQSQTTFKDTVKTYGIPDLNAYVHPYVVLGNQGNYSPTFDPREHGVEPLSVVAVVCGDKLVYGIWGDTNGDDGPPLVGESSLATGTLCFSDTVNGNSGHDEADVLFIAFTGKDAVPGKDGANWNTTSTEEFESSIQELGNKLIQRLSAPQKNGASKRQAVWW